MPKLLASIGILLVLSACQPDAADRAHRRRTRALTRCLEQANEHLAQENLRRWQGLAGWKEKFKSHSPDPALDHLLLRCDSIRAGATRLRQQLVAIRHQCHTLAVRDPDEVVGPALLAAATRLLGQFAAYRATLRAIDRQVVLTRLAPLADTTAPALASFYFREAPPAEALAALAQLEAAIVGDEAAAVLAQDVQLSCRNVMYNEVGIRAVPDSTVVVAGQEYRARLSLFAIPKPVGMTMSVNGQPIAVMPDGIGQVRFIADPRLLGNRQEATAHWDGLIRVKSAYTHSGDTTYKVRVPYRIVRSR
jgi:hypothetical protein